VPALPFANSVQNNGTTNLIHQLNVNFWKMYPHTKTEHPDRLQMLSSDKEMQRQTDACNYIHHDMMQMLKYNRPVCTSMTSAGIHVHSPNITVTELSTVSQLQKQEQWMQQLGPGLRQWGTASDRHQMARRQRSPADSQNSGHEEP